MCGHPSTDTHMECGVDVGFGFEQCDDRIGVTTVSSLHQRRIIDLRTQNDTERQSECVGHPSTDTHVISGVDVGLGFDQCDDDIGTAIMSSIY